MATSPSQSHRRRRRRRSSQARTSAQTVRLSAGQRQFQVQTAEILGTLGVLVAAAALIGIIWINASRSIDSFQSDTRARAEAATSADALVLAEQIRRELLGVDQTLKMLKHAFEADPDHFDISTWSEQLPVLTDVSEDVFIADQQFIIQQDIRPQAVGMGVASSAYLGTNQGSLEVSRDDSMIIGATAQGTQSRQYLTYLMLRLERPGGWIIGASYRTAAITRMFQEAPLGMRGMTALVNTKVQRIQAVAGPAAMQPNADISTSQMFEAMRTRPDATWSGPSPDDVQRIHAFRNVPGRDLAVVVAVDETDAMQPAVTWAQGVRMLAWGATVVALLLAAVMIHGVWTFRANRRRRQALDRERAIVEVTRGELGGARAREAVRAAQIQALLGNVAEGVLIGDAEQRVTEWNERFPALYPLPDGILRTGLPLDEMLRAQANAGDFGPLDDVEAEVQRRMAELRAGGPAAGAAYSPTDGQGVAVRSVTLPDGGLMLVVTRHAGQTEPATPLGGAARVDTL